MKIDLTSSEYASIEEIKEYRDSRPMNSYVRHMLNSALWHFHWKEIQVRELLEDMEEE